MAPLVAGIIGLLTGATIPLGVIGVAAGAQATKIAAVDRTAAVVYGDLQAACPLADRLIDDAGDKADATWGKTHKFWASVLDKAVKDADAVCSNTKLPNTPIGRTIAAVDAAKAIARVNGLDAPADSDVQESAAPVTRERHGR